jgi:DNA replication protein DnaC
LGNLLRSIWGIFSDRYDLTWGLTTARDTERGRRSFERRVAEARLGSFKSLADFDGQWPSRIDRALVEELLGLGFLEDASKIVLVGPNGVGKGESRMAKVLDHYPPSSRLAAS